MDHSFVGVRILHKAFPERTEENAEETRTKKG
jgi:hypothetical protein